MGKFVITRRSNGEFQFNLKAGNGETILTSEGYSSRQGCEAGIVSVRINAPFDLRYDRRTSVNQRYYFNLLAANGQVIGTSEMYENAAGRESGIASVKSNAPGAVTEDLA
jgi:hypothetical protein